MKVKQTIAFIGYPGDACWLLLPELAAAGYPVIWVREENDTHEGFPADPEGFPGADIEIVSCPREGCWHADVIMLDQRAKGEERLWRKIKEVASQKIVVIVCKDEMSTSYRTEERAALQQLLPYTEWVQATIYPAAKETELIGRKEAAADIAAIFAGIAYKVNLLEPA